LNANLTLEGGVTANINHPDFAEGTPPRSRITVFGVGGAGCNAVKNMVSSDWQGIGFVVANTDLTSLERSLADRQIQLGPATTRGLGAGSDPDMGRLAAEETTNEIQAELHGSLVVFITAGMGGGTGTGAAPVIARVARNLEILRIGVVTTPFHFEGTKRMRIAEEGIRQLEQVVDALIVIPNQNLLSVSTKTTTLVEAFKMADDVLATAVRGIVDLMDIAGLINLDFADIQSTLHEMGRAIVGTGEAEGENRAIEAVETAINYPLLGSLSIKGAKGLLINITAGPDLTLSEVDTVVNTISHNADADARINFGHTLDEQIVGRIRVTVVATGMDSDNPG
jgi:cell division protein FtsZ